MPKHITETTELKCNQGAIPTPLSVTSQTFMKIEGKLQATEEDCKPNVNIKPFGTCLATNSACVPATQKWENTSEFDIDNKKELLDTSTCKCSAGNGTISVVKSAQTFSEEGGKTIYQPIVYDYNKKEDEEDDIDENIYEIEENGCLINRGKSDKDIVYASKNFQGEGKDRKLKTENDGGVVVGEKGFIKKNSKTRGAFDYIDFGRNNEETAINYFYYAAKNSFNEFGIITEYSYTAVGTNYNKSNVSDMLKIITTDYNVTLFGHSHPGLLTGGIQMSGTLNPSGFLMTKFPLKENGYTFHVYSNTEEGDRSTSKRFPRSINFVYARQYDTTITYNSEKILEAYEGKLKK